MSIAHEQRIADLEKKMAEYAGMSTIEFRKHLAELEMRVTDLQSHLIDTNNHLLRANERIEMLEQTAARKPGPKPKGQP